MDGSLYRVTAIGLDYVRFVSEREIDGKQRRLKFDRIKLAEQFPAPKKKSSLDGEEVRK